MKTDVLTRVALAALLLIGAAARAASAADERLMEAVKAADRAAVRALIAARTDVNDPEADGTTALHWAARADDAMIVDLLIEAGADATAVNRYGVTALWLAALNGNAVSIERLLAAGADANAATPDGETVLMIVARTGRVEAIKPLLGHGADVNAREGWHRQTALMWAAAEGHADVVRLLVEFGADVEARSEGGFTPLLFAAREGRLGAVQALVAAGAAPDEALPARRRRPDPDTAAAPAEPRNGLTAFLVAAANAHYELAAWLLDQGADPGAAPEGWTALHQVSWVRKAGIAGSNNPAPEGSGALDSRAFVRKVVAAGADVNARVTGRPDMGITSLNAAGGTPFVLAARTADVELMRLLVELGADPQLATDDGTTPLLVAAGVGTSSPGEDPGTEPEVLEALALALALGNDPNAVDKNGETAMHGAAYKHLPAVVRYLADRGAREDVWNRENAKGWTPLRIAEGVHRGMNIISSAPTAAAIREVMARSAPRASAPR